MKLLLKHTATILMFLISMFVITLLNELSEDKISYSTSNWFLLIVITLQYSRFYKWLFEAENAGTKF